MDLQQLRYVVEVADLGSFTKAAERCFVTQSALSHQIAALEREIGALLFARTSRSVRVTEAGEAFVRQARVALDAARAAAEDAAAVNGRVVGVLRLGVIPTVAVVDVPALIAGFRAAHPECRVELAMGNSDTLIAAVRQGSLDVAMIGLRADAAPAGVAHRELARERLVAVVPAGHRLARRARIALAELERETFADFPAGTSGRAQSDSAFTASGIIRDVAYEVGTAELLVGLVAAGLAVALLAPGVVHPGESRVVQVPVVGGPERIEYVVWPEQAPRQVARALLEELDGLLEQT
ncbi:LysR family transcriptional regulator [Microbacterium sp. ZW T5_45]|uniref:LysR family transcriptional regulator n=1 Tax=Microbacterium sp. ZW T5_45 TaxID=3378080 RepID=UPI003853AE21